MELLNFLSQYLHIDNIKKSWRTTIIGLMLIAGGFVSKFVPIAGQITSWNEVILAVSFGVLLCFSNVKAIPNNPTDNSITTE